MRRVRAARISAGRRGTAVGHESVRVVGMIAGWAKSVKLGKWPTGGESEPHSCSPRPESSSGSAYASPRRLGSRRKRQFRINLDKQSAIEIDLSQTDCVGRIARKEITDGSCLVSKPGSPPAA